MGRWRLAGVILLLLVQTALAAFLGFLATIHWDEGFRFYLNASLPYAKVREATLRYIMEFAGAAVDAACTVMALLLLLLVISRAKCLPSVRPAFRFAGGLYLFTFAGLFFAAFGVPMVGSPHDDMFPGLGFFISSAAVLFMSGCSFGIALLLKSPLGLEPRP
jgi:hypothetical protein